MLAHGEYRLEWHGDILHSTPTGNFNEQGIHAYAQSLWQTVAKRSDWVLYLHLGAAPGLTPEALHELIATYQQLERFGCIALVAEVPMLWAGFLETRLFSQLNLPALESDDPDLLDRFVTAQISHRSKIIDM